MSSKTILTDTIYFRFGDPVIQLPLSHCFLIEAVGFISLDLFGFDIHNDAFFFFSYRFHLNLGHLQPHYQNNNSLVLAGFLHKA